MTVTGNFKNGRISIPKVTGDVIITATGNDGWVSGVNYNLNLTTYKWINTDGEVLDSTNGADRVSDKLPCHGASAIIIDTVNGNGPYNNTIHYYDNTDTQISKVIVTLTAIENPYPCPVPRNAYYARIYSRSENIYITPYLYQKLSSNWSLNTHYVFNYEPNTETSITKSLIELCPNCAGYKLQTSMTSRSWIYFYDRGQIQISSTIRQGTDGTLIDIPAETQYIAIDPGSLNWNNTNNPWILITEETA